MTRQIDASRPRTVFVLGAAGGMASGINDVLGDSGHNLICADLEGTRLLEEVERLHSKGVEAKALFVDARSAGDVRRTCESLIRDGINVDVFVNAAGVLDRKSIFEHDDESFSEVIGVNLVGPFNFIRFLSAGMVERGWGRIINVSSIAAQNGYPFPSYASSKAGLANLTRSLVGEFWGTGVTVNNIAPGIVDTPMAERQLIQEAEWRVPSGHAVKPEEIGNLVSFLISEDARNINGADLVVDGGITSYFQVRSRHESR